MRHVIVGAGAVGGTIGALLFRHGADVTFAARGAHGDALRTRGLRFETPDGAELLPIPAVATPAEAMLGEDTALWLAVKSQDTAALLAEVFGRDGPSDGPAFVVCAQNGVENERLALRRTDRIVAMCVMLPAAHLTPGVVQAYGVPYPGLLDVGWYPDGAGGAVDELAASLTAAGFDSLVRADVMRWKYRKLLMNLGNVVDAALGAHAPDVSLAIARRAEAEAEAVYAAAAIAYATAEEDRERRGDLLRMRPVEGQRREGGSSWQSVSRHTPLETPWLNGEIVLLGRLHGVPAPVNSALCELGRRLTRSGVAPGTLEPAEVEALLDRC